MTTIAQGIIEFGGDASGVTAATAEVGKSLDSIGSKVKTLGNESGDGFKKVEDGAKGAAKATQTWNEYLKENIAEARKQFAAQDLSKADAYSASVKKVAESWKEMQKARQSASTPIPLGAGDVDALTKAQDRLLNSIVRQATVVTEGKAKWLELRAAQAGISEQATPYIAKLKSIEKSTSDLGISQGQLTAAMRNVPAQFTDIITSLQGGQKPLTVLLQQGGQLKDMFGGAGNAARALGGYVLGLVNPFTIAAGAVGVLAVAYNQGSAEAQQFANALITTGNAAGTTKNQLMDMARTISESGMSTQGAAAEALTALVGTGKVGVDNLQKFASVAVQAQKVIGASIQDTAKDFAELGKSPLQASIKLDEQYNFLTVSIYKQIKALQDQGRATEAATLAQNTYADSLASRTAGIEQNLGSIERGWIGVKNFAKSAWDEMLGIGRETTESERINQLQTNIKNRLDFIARERPQSLLIPKAQNDNATDQRELDILLKKTEQQKIQADLKAKENAAKNAGLEFDRQGDEFLTKKAKLTNEIAKATNTYLKSIESDPRSNAEKEKDLVLTERLGKIREKYKESVSKEESAYKSLSRTISEKVALSQLELSSEKPLTESQKLRVKLMELVADGHGKITKAQIAEQNNKINLIQANESLAITYKNLYSAIDKLKPEMLKNQADILRDIEKETKNATEQAKKWMQEQRDNYASANKSLDDHAQKMRETNELAQLEIDLLGMSAAERNTIIEQKKIQLALDREIQKIREMTLTDTARQDLIDKATSQANIDKSTASLRAQQGEWSKFYGEIYNGLSDSLYRGFEAGKGFGQSFIDSLKNMLKANVLKISVQAVMDTGMGFLGGQAKPQEGQSGGGMSSILSMFGGGGSSSGAGSAAATIKGYASTIGVAMAMYSIGRSIAGDYKIGGMNSAFSTLIGSGVGARLFGMADKQMGGQTVTGSLGTDNLMRNQAWTQDGGLFRSDRSGTWSYGLNNSVATTADGKSYTDTKNLESDKQLLQVLNDSYANVKAITTDFAKTLGLSAESIAARKDAINLTLGKTQEETNAAIGKVFEDISNTIASSLSPAIASFSKAGESAADTLARLAGSLTDVNAVIGAAGLKKFDTSVEGGAQASQLADLAGGIQKLSTGTQFFFDNFLNDAEKIKPSIDQVAATMARLGMSNVKTIEDFKLAIKGGEDASGKLVQGLDLTTESGAKMYAELIAIAPQFKAVADYVTETTKAVEDNTAALQRAKQIEGERKSLQDEYNQLTMTSTQLYELYKNGLDESNRALADSIQAIKLKSTEEAAAAAKLAEEQSKANAIASERSSIQNEINQLTMTSAQLLDLQRNGLNEANRALFDFLQATKEKIATEKQLADIQKSIDDQRFSLMSEYNELTMTNEQRLQAQRFAIDQSNVALYDQIVALKDKNKADAESAAAAKVISDQRKSLQDEYNNLTMTEAQLLDLRRSTYDAANRDLFDAIQAEKATRAKALEDQKAYNDSVAELQRQAQAIASERASLQDEYNQLTMTEIQLMELKKATLNSSNRDLFDLIQAEKLRRAEQSKIEESAKAAQSEYAQAMQSAADSLKSYLNDIVSEFGSLAKSLQDFSRGLTVGETSKISPEDRYKLLGAEVNALLPKVQSGDKKALGEWTKISQEYLESSQDYNATNLQYFKDLAFIKEHTDAAAIYAQSQVDVAQLQLDLMGDQLGALRTLNSSVLDVVSAINGANSSSSSSAGSVSAASSMSLVQGYKGNVLQNLEGYGGLESLYSGATTGNTDAYKTLKKQMERWSMMGLDKNALDQILGAGWYEKLKAIPGFAKGGLANGLAMVGENGAELVNFKSPARVYNSNDTKSILGGNPEASKETNDLLKKQNALMEKLISKLEGTANKNQKGLENVAQKIGVVNANAKFQMAGT